jgi:hypothetical protein
MLRAILLVLVFVLVLDLLWGAFSQTFLNLVRRRSWVPEMSKRGARKAKLLKFYVRSARSMLNGFADLKSSLCQF